MGIVAVVFLVVVLLQTLHWTHEHIDATANRQAQLAIEFDRAIRDYVRKHIRPEFASRVGPGEFVPETMSTSFISRRIFESVREALPDSLLRFPSTNPRNPVNRATPEEEAILRYFEQNPDARSWEGTITYGDKGERYFVRAAPYPFAEECLTCHGRPDDAPASLVKRYGPVAGFGRSASDLSLELVALPVQAYYAEADWRLWQHMLVAVLVCLLFLAGIAALVVLDVKSRAQSRRLLELSNQRFDQIAEHSRTVAWEIDAEGRFTYVSHAAEQVLGLSPESLVGKDCLIAHPEKRREEFRALLHDTMTRKEPFHNLENPVETPDGRIVWVATSGFPILGKDGTLLGYRGSAIDITEHKEAARAVDEALAEAERSRRKAIRMADAAEAAHQRAMATSKMLMEETQRSHELALQAQAACQSKSEFLANMSHEIRTPMTAILGFAETLLGELDEDDASSVRRHAVETIQRNGEHLLSLINDVLDLSKIEAGRIDMNTTPCSPAMLLADVRALMRLRAEEKRLSLTIEYDGPIPQQIQTDPLRLRQILINLIGNAIKFTESGGVRIIACLMYEPDQTTRLRFDIADSGIGIAEGQIARLFQPFTQADSSTTREFGGTGLGLTISKRFAEMLGGGITVTSAPGKGSVFTLTIETGPLDGVALIEGPAHDSLLEGRFAAPPVGPSASGDVRLDCRILLAEDSPDIQRLVGLVLEKAGARVTVVGNGRLAVDAGLAAKESGRPFDVILMDMQMPVVDGYLAARELRQHGYTGVIIALTAHAMTEDRQKCLDAGCDDYATKPIDRGGLLEVVRRHAVNALFVAR